jgi:integrase
MPAQSNAAPAAASTKPSAPTGIIKRHRRSCRTYSGGHCNCKPAFRAWVFDRRTGRKVSKTFPTQAAAKQWRAHAVGEVRNNKMQPASSRSLREAAEKWLDEIEAGAPLARGKRPYKPSVLRGYRADFTRYVMPDLGGLRVSDVRRSDLQRLVDRLLGQGLSPSKVANVLMPLRSIFRHLIEHDEIVVNPTANVQLPTERGVRDRAASVDEAEALIRALPEASRALWATAFYAGLRRGEIQGLRWSDIDLAQGVIRVARSWDAQAGYVEPKSRKGIRAVPVMGALRDYLVENKTRTGRDGDDLVFGRSATNPFTATHVRKQALAAWKVENARRAGQGLKPLVPIGLHELRHSCVTFMHEAGLSLEEIGDLVGHSSTYMTDRYRHLREERRDALAAKLDRYHAENATLAPIALAS